MSEFLGRTSALFVLTETQTQSSGKEGEKADDDEKRSPEVRVDRDSGRELGSCSSLSLSLPPSHSPRAHRLASLAPHCFCRGSALDLHDDRPSNASKRSPFFSLLASSRRLLLPLLLSCQSAAAFLSFLFVTTDAQDMHTQAAPLASLIYQSCVVNSAIVETKKERKRSSVAALMP